MIEKTHNWTTHLPDAFVGVLAVTNVTNLPSHPALESARSELENHLRTKYSSETRTSLREDPTWAAYDAFYRPFKKTYHVQLQLESVIFKNKPINSPSALVACMFMAELKTGLLTAAHDLSSIKPPLSAEIASGVEIYQRLDGSRQQLKAGDLFISDQEGILSSVIYGPDQRTQVGIDTDQVLFTTYGPPGIHPDQIQSELELLESYIRLFTPGAERSLLIVL